MAEVSGSGATRSDRIPAIERATDRPWADWLELFTAAGAKQLSHPGIAAVARAAMPESLENPDWWAQGVAIAYEHEIGLRIPGQSSTGDFQVSATRTVPLDRDAAIAAWVGLVGDEREHRGHGVTNVRESQTDKRTYWRADLDGAGKLDVAASAKGEGRALLAIQHRGLASEADISPWRDYWKTRLAEL